MNWTKVIAAGVAAGIVMWLTDFVMHGVLLRATYEKHSTVFAPDGNPLWFLVLSVLIATLATALFAKTRSSWGQGFGGGATYGFWMGLVAFFTNFYPSLVINGFPYFLSWCWGGAGLITAVIAGGVIGVVYKNG